MFCFALRIHCRILSLLVYQPTRRRTWIPGLWNQPELAKVPETRHTEFHRLHMGVVLLSACSVCYNIVCISPNKKVLHLECPRRQLYTVNDIFGMYTVVVVPTTRELLSNSCYCTTVLV